ncbi:1-acylglycerol-3-phosphate O-acyltransferase [Linnemannia schmuckeri]|uniref:1-acyl-sn-glycerol-3-phosphate acyltransferase n=1 Tax=Linnemannia schmuckeri TaxID=64567 RepID=A0A9P5RUQ1_9FUNG|nr:1-acylglycerol-3-phosphate O-acyltransferase [Linnemannia schmuckeri]
MSSESTIPWGLIAVPAFILALPRLLAVLPQKIQFVTKCGVVLIATFIMSIVGCFISIVFALLNRRHEINFVVARIFSFIASYPCGVTFKVSGEEHLEKYPAIVVCNHQSSMDMMILGRVFPKHCVVMAKKELQYFPFLGIFMTLSNAIFIDRKNHKKAIESTTQAVTNMKKHNSGIWIFPEGTRSRLETAYLLPFKKGAFHLAIQSQQPIMPIVAAGYSNIYDSASRSFPGGELEIRVLEPIPTTGMTVDDVNDLMERTRAVMLKSLKEMDHSVSSASNSTGSSTAVAEGTIDEGLKQRRTAKE